MIKECFDIDIEQLVILVGVDKAYKAQEFIIDLSQFEEYELELNERFKIWESISNLS